MAYRTIRAKAYIPSIGEYNTLKEKYPAFVAAQLSRKAYEQNSSFNVSTDCGTYPLRNFHSWECKGKFYYVNSYGKLECGWPVGVGLRVALSLKYNRKSSIVRRCRLYTQEDCLVDYSGEKGVYHYETVTSIAPVVTFGGIKYIWTNKEDCENGKSQVMNCISLKLIERAEPFEIVLGYVDYAQAENLHAQCERVAFANATKKEKAMVVEVEMSERRSKGYYESLSYQFSKNADKYENEIELGF